jgi:hypothetical protein
MSSDDTGPRPKPTEGKDNKERGISRKQVSQTDVPAFTLDEALRIPETLRDQYAKQPTKPIDVARALPMSPTSGTFKMLTGAAIAYGLTTGGARAETIALTDLGLVLWLQPKKGMTSVLAVRRYYSLGWCGSSFSDMTALRYPPPKLRRTCLSKWVCLQRPQIELWR